MIWRVNKDEALEAIVDGACVGGIWRGTRKTGKRHVSKPAAVVALAMVGIGVGPHDIVEAGYFVAAWHPYRRLGFFATVKEAKKALEDDREASRTTP